MIDGGGFLRPGTSIGTRTTMAIAIPNDLPTKRFVARPGDSSPAVRITVAVVPRRMSVPKIDPCLPNGGGEEGPRRPPRRPPTDEARRPPLDEDRRPRPGNERGGRRDRSDRTLNVKPYSERPTPDRPEEGSGSGENEGGYVDFRPVDPPDLPPNRPNGGY
jgi:hypothetical protein